MSGTNPYKSPSAAPVVHPEDRVWQGGTEAVLAAAGLLRRRVIVTQPVAVTIEYLGRGLRDRILVDGATAVSLIPVFWFHERFDFHIPFRDGRLHVSVRLKIGRFLRIKRFSIQIADLLVYREENGQPVTVHRTRAAEIPAD